MLQSSADRFAVTLAVGPGDHELVRLRDVLTSLKQHETTILAGIFVVDDTGGSHNLDSLRSEFPVLRIVPSRRSGRGDAWRGGLTTNILLGFQAAFAEPTVRFVLKVDTDTMCLAPFSARVLALFAMYQTTGIIGSCYATNLQGEPVAPSTWIPNLRKHAALIRLRRHPLPHVEVALLGRRRLIRRLIHRAIWAGWSAGQCAQGGGYAVGRKLFEQLQRSGALSDEFLWLDSDLCEDVVMALLCYSHHFTVRDENKPGAVFGVQFTGLAFSPGELITRRYAIVHSLKMSTWEQELSLRDSLKSLVPGRSS